MVGQALGLFPKEYEILVKSFRVLQLNSHLAQPTQRQEKSELLFHEAMIVFPLLQNAHSVSPIQIHICPLFLSDHNPPCRANLATLVHVNLLSPYDVVQENRLKKVHRKTTKLDLLMIGGLLDLVVILSFLLLQVLSL